VLLASLVAMLPNIYGRSFEEIFLPLLLGPLALGLVALRATLALINEKWPLRTSGFPYVVMVFLFAGAGGVVSSLVVWFGEHFHSTSSAN
jgi:hypothetical protein